MHRLRPTRLRAAVWALGAVLAARRIAQADGLTTRNLTPPPPLPADARFAVLAVLRRTQASCLTRSLVLQAWDAAHGLHRDIVIGVTSPADGFKAHAWLDGEADASGFTELVRRAPPR